MSNTIKKKKKSIDELLGGAKLPQRRLPVCFRGDIWAEIQGLDEQLRTIEADDEGRFVGNPEARKLAERIDALRAEMREGTEEFVLQALPRSKWTELRALHPPRKDNNRDLISGGVNIDTFSAALLPMSVVSPVLTEAHWERLGEVLSDRQYEELVSCAWNVNQDEVSVPFSQAASKIRNSGSESKRLND